jgi:hypothetical protein
MLSISDLPMELTAQDGTFLLLIATVVALQSEVRLDWDKEE